MSRDDVEAITRLLEDRYPDDKDAPSRVATLLACYYNVGQVEKMLHPHLRPVVLIIEDKKGAANYFRWAMKDFADVIVVDTVASMDLAFLQHGHAIRMVLASTDTRESDPLHHTDPVLQAARGIFPGFVIAVCDHKPRGSEIFRAGHCQCDDIVGPRSQAIEYARHELDRMKSVEDKSRTGDWLGLLHHCIYMKQELDGWTMHDSIGFLDGS